MPSVTPKLSTYWSVDTVRSSDGKTIRFGVYKKGAAPTKRAIVFANGRSEWLEKYDFLPELLKIPEDCIFVTWDHRGQGASDGGRATIDSYDTYVADMQAVIQTAVGDIPYVQLAHSMGGLITLYGILKQATRPQRAALSSPLLLLPEIGMSRGVAKKVANLFAVASLGEWHVGLGRVEKAKFAKNPLTHSIQAYELIQSTPYKIPSPTFTWIKATFQATDFVFDKEVISTLTVPTLVMGGSEETVVDPGGFSRWSQLAGSLIETPIRFDMISGARHELLNETPQYLNQAIANIRNWFRDFLETP